jgi:hypothetical protein
VLLPDQVIPFLQHDDRVVRELAARYLSEAHDPSPATADDFWRSIDRFGAEASVALVCDLVDLPWTERSYFRLIETLRSGPAEIVEYHLQRTVERLDYPLLLAHREEVLSAEPILSHVRDHLRQRIEMSDRPLDAVWNALLAHSEKIEGMYVDEIDMRESDRLIEVAARHGEPAGLLALDRLRNGPRDDWMEIFCVRLLGDLRFAPAVDVLIERLDVDADLLPAELGRALARVGTADVIEKLEAFYRGKDLYVRMSVNETLARIKRPESERAVLRLLERETEEELPTQLADALCHLCTTEGLGVVERMVGEGSYDSQFCDLDELFLAVATMTGYEPRNGADLRRRVARRRKRREERMKSATAEDLLRELRDRYRRGEFGLPQPDEDDGDFAYGDELREWDDYAPPAGETIRRDAPKVGRNDPCPCGSGKKYKKCCLSKAHA